MAMDNKFPYAHEYLKAYQLVDQAMTEKHIKAERLVEQLMLGDEFDPVRVRAAIARLLRGKKNVKTRG
jgi:hypothetical protein